jgi:hypothetical protein
MIVPNNMSISKCEGFDYSNTNPKAVAIIKRDNSKGCNDGNYDKQRSFFYAKRNIYQKNNRTIIQSYERAIQLHYCEIRHGLKQTYHLIMKWVL